MSVWLELSKRQHSRTGNLQALFARTCQLLQCASASQPVNFVGTRHSLLSHLPSTNKYKYIARRVFILYKKCKFRLNWTSIGGGLTVPVMTTTSTVTSTERISASCRRSRTRKPGSGYQNRAFLSPSRHIMGSNLNSHSRFIPLRFQFIS
jgi:diaminopimelate decarboxylase